MTSKPAQVILDNEELSVEMEVDLGDPRRTDRLQRIINLLSKKPDSSYPEIFSKSSDIEGFYRFIRNDNVSFKTIMEAHQSATIERAEKLDEVLVLHDTTKFAFPLYDSTVREGLCKFSTNLQGFFGHASLIVSADGTRCPLGVVDMLPFPNFSQLMNEPAKKFWIEQTGELESEYCRWYESISNTSKLLSNVDKVIHVADREIDSYKHFSAMKKDKHKFVFRMTTRHNVKKNKDSKPLNIVKLFASQPVLGQGEIELNARKKSPKKPASKAAQPIRPQRKATISFKAKKILFRRPVGIIYHTLPKYIYLNVVQAIEINPPRGEEPVNWLLATSESIKTVEDVINVIDIYRSRWIVEEYFKSIKTGCSYEKRQLETAQTLLVALAMTIPIAWRLLVIRHLNRDIPNKPARIIFTNPQLEILKKEYPKHKWSTETTIGEATSAMAKLGGHLYQNGPPGWFTLGRGYSRLLEMERGWLFAMETRTCDQ